MKTWHYYLPIYWPIWLLLGIFWLLIQLPFRWQLKLGAGLGLLMMRFATKSRFVATINLQLCFPELTPAQREQLLKKSFQNIGIALFETGMGFWASDKRLKNLIEIENAEYFTNPPKQGRGVLLLGAHFTTLEIIGRACAMRYDICVMYRPHKIGILNYILTKALTKHYRLAIPRNDIRGMIKALQAGKVIWYSADVNAGRKKSVFAPFFNIPAATTKAPMRFAKLSNCAVVPSFHYRKEDGTYKVKMLPALENFPTQDEIADATQINQIIEQAIRKIPEQYLWQYMRFKTRPISEKSFYKKHSSILDSDNK
ncbi:MAG: hypothetical protein A3E87_06700 [Gammaproteobacteria bacterium RIFCSPHIGHO2_12_FULL_35_23]|nr:MAG: hypothetical protein A3E87_06700 [Gammaproteobacteria bacterium RIFCSPHIGHO2_12_FULL_35_23]